MKLTKCEIDYLTWLRTEHYVADTWMPAGLFNRWMHIGGENNGGIRRWSTIRDFCLAEADRLRRVRGQS
jgi:hypothetical protein